jgi:hypothetical protein
VTGVVLTEEQLADRLRDAVCECGHKADWHSALAGCNAEDYDQDACDCDRDWVGAMRPVFGAFMQEQREAIAQELRKLRPTTLTNMQDDLLDECIRIARGGSDAVAEALGGEQ